MSNNLNNLKKETSVCATRSFKIITSLKLINNDLCKLWNFVYTT